MADIKQIILNTSDEELEDVIAPFIEEQFPKFMRTDYRKIVSFVKAYYEWLDTQGNPGYVMGKLDTVSDVDRNVDEFYSHFKNTYLSAFPELFATNTLGNKPNKKTLLKKIRDFYGNKGTENSFKFLFRVLYDSDLEIYLPKNDILKVSDGRWIEPRSVKTTSTNTSNLFSMKNGEALQYNGSGGLIASATVESVVQYSFGGFPVTEFFLSNINGDFLPNENIVFRKDTEEYTEKTYSVLGGFNIELSGSGYKVGDIIAVTTTTGSGFSAKVEQVGLAGGIKRIGIINSGINYPTDVVVSIVSETGVQTAIVKALRSAVTEYPGYFLGNNGKISSNKRIQDGHYYQDFSYELKSEVSFDVCHEVLKHLVHPAGTRMFNSISIKKSIDNTVTSSAQQITFETPVIGRYTPYALRTFNDLRGGYFLPNQVKGATLQVWLSGYNIAGNTSSGITAGWGVLPNAFSIGSAPGGRSADREDIFGVRHWSSVVGGHTFSHPLAYPNSNVWLTPNFQRESLNTHPTVRIRPVQYNFIGPAYGSALVSLGFSGPTIGALGLSLAASYFAVAKPGRLTQINGFGNNTTGNMLLGDRGAYRGIIFGLTGADITVPKIAAFSFKSGTDIKSIIGSIGKTGEWKLISHTLAVGAGNSGAMSLFLDGICLGTAATAGIDPNTHSIYNFHVGQQRSDSLIGAFDGEIAEILAYEGALSDGDRQKVEGYLAHKYNLDGNLPQGHPYKTTPPGASLPAGGWCGSAGDFYPNGYNPYIGVSTEIGPNGNSASVGSLFFNSGMGYTYTVMDEFGLTAHNPIGAPLGGLTAWTRGNEQRSAPDQFSGLVLWLKPENIGVCGAFVSGACMDVWRDASPNKNDAIPPTWDFWNDVAQINHTANTATSWGRHVSDNTTPVTKLAVVFNGACGGWKTGRLCIVGLSENPTAVGDDDIDNYLYSYGPYGSSTETKRRILSGFKIPGKNNNMIDSQTDLVTGTTVLTAFDNTVFELEYVEPNIIFRVDGREARRGYVGYGKTYYFDSSYFLAGGDAANAGTSVTIKELSYNGKRVTPVFGTVSAGVTTSVYAGVTIDSLRPKIAFKHLGITGATGISFNGGVLYSAESTWVGSGSDGKTLGVKGITFYAGFTGEKLLTGRHFNLTKPIVTNTNKDMDMFVVYQTSSDAYDRGVMICSSYRFTRQEGHSLAFSDGVAYAKSWNNIDRTPAYQTSVYYSVQGGVFRYPSAAGLASATGLFGFRPRGGFLGNRDAECKTIAYDPHVSGVCSGVVIAEAARDTDGTIYAWVNGDRATNFSRSTGRYVANAVGNASESPFPVSGVTMSIGRFGSLLRSTLSADSSLVFGSQAWVNAALTNASYGFEGVIYEVIVYDRKLSETERQGVYAYLTRKYATLLETKMPDAFRLSHPSAFAHGITYWDIENHPNNKNLSTIPFGSEFSGIPLLRFFALPDSIYNSSGTVLSDGTVLNNDTYTNVGL